MGLIDGMRIAHFTTLARFVSSVAVRCVWNYGSERADHQRRWK